MSWSRVLYCPDGCAIYSSASAPSFSKVPPFSEKILPYAWYIHSRGGRAAIVENCNTSRGTCIHGYGLIQYRNMQNQANGMSVQEEKPMSTFTTNNKQEALERFNDFPWYTRVVSENTEKVGGGLWGFEDAGDAGFAGFIASIPLVITFTLIFPWLGWVWAGICIVLWLLVVLSPVVKNRNKPKYTVEWVNGSHSGVSNRVSMVERGVFNDTETTRNIGLVDISTHKENFRRLMYND